MIKRLIDVIGSMVLILTLSPVFLITFFMVLFKLGFPVIFKQKRPGKNKTPFMFYKFRSMTNEVDKEGKLLPNEKRLTSFGKFLRKSSLDELPSLFNVLKGDLSLVGPRPLRLKYNDCYTKEQDKRHLVKPGITGLAQVNGRTAISWEDKFAWDVKYVENQSILLDVKILFKTVLVVLAKKDVGSKTSHFELPLDEYLKKKLNG